MEVDSDGDRDRSRSRELDEEACDGALQSAETATVNIEEIRRKWFRDVRDRSLVFPYCIKIDEKGVVGAMSKLVCRRNDPDSFGGGGAKEDLRKENFKCDDILETKATLICLALRAHSPYHERGPLNHVFPAILTRKDTRSTSWTVWVLDSNPNDSSDSSLSQLVQRRVAWVLPRIHSVENIAMTTLFPPQRSLKQHLSFFLKWKLLDYRGICYLYVCATLYVLLRVISWRLRIRRRRADSSPLSGQQIMEEIFRSPTPSAPPGEELAVQVRDANLIEAGSFSKDDETALLRWMVGIGSCRGTHRDRKSQHPIVRAVRIAEKEMPLYEGGALRVVMSALPLLRKHPSWLKRASSAVRSSVKAVYTAVFRDGMMLEYASRELKDLKKIVLAAVKQNGNAIRFASASMRTDPEIVEAALKHGSSTVLKYVADHVLMTDPGLFKLAVRVRGSLLRSCPEKFRGDWRIVLSAVRNDGSMLQYASDELRKDPDIALVATQNAPSALAFVDPVAFRDEELLKEAVKWRGKLLSHGSSMAKADPELVKIAVEQDGLALEYASEHLRDQKKIVLSAVRQNGEALRFASPTLQSDPDVLRAALVRGSPPGTGTL
jgi:hypothetical protein